MANKKQYGNVQGAAAGLSHESEGHLLMQSWAYLGLAGALGALLAWAICEPAFVDDMRDQRWGNVLLVPLVVIFMCVGYGIAEGVVERSTNKAVVRGLLSLVLGAVLGFVFYFIGNVIFTIGLAIVGSTESIDPTNPGVWFARAIAWVTFGVVGGLVYGIVGQSARKCGYGVLGGMLGAGIGGFLFDPVALIAGTAGFSRALGLTIFGGLTGAAIGLVENALKDRWLHVVSGPLAGKQFILYKARTVIGSNQAADIYLFKDPSIAPQHACIELRGHQAVLTAQGATSVSGMPVQQRLLKSGDQVQIGRYAFSYMEKQRS